MIFKAFFRAFLLSSVVAGAASWVIYDQTKGAALDPARLEINPKPTIVYDKNGNPMAQFYGEVRKTPTKFEQIPDEIIKALVATEDQSFFSHSGVHVKGIARALVTDIKTGDFSEGGSTLTQQLVKLLYLDSGKRLERKRDEAIYATMLEQRFSKQEIIAFYLDHIFYGYRSYGVQDAVETYFNESLADFKKGDPIDRIAKAALIAGIPNLPSRYSPYENPEGTMERRNLVLSRMLEQGYITKEQHDQAVKKPFLVLKEPNVVHKDEQIRNKEFVHFALKEAETKLHYNSLDEVMNGGLKIYTSFDPAVDATLAAQFQNAKNFPSDSSKNDAVHVEGAAVLLNPQNGEVLALAGGRTPEDNKRFLDFNRAFQSKRQPGSAIKPLVDYAPAIESGKFSMYSTLLDEKGHDFGGGYRPHDWDGNGRGSVSMSEAIRQSWNIPAVWTLQQIGVKYAKEFTKKLGLDLDADNSGLPMAIGGLDQGVSPFEMADAYQAFANGGFRVPAHGVRQIVSNSGKEVYAADTEPVRVMKTETYDQMRYMLRNVVRWGTGTGANIAGQMISGKTGSTEYPGVSAWYKDVWFAGVTKDYVGVVWMGYDNTDEKHHLASDSGVAAKMFKAVMEPLLKAKPDPESGYKTPSVARIRQSDFDLKENSVSEESQHIQWADIQKYISSDEARAAEKKAKEEQDKKAKEELDAKAKEELDAKAKEEEARKAKEEQDRKAKEDQAKQQQQQQPPVSPEQTHPGSQSSPSPGTPTASDGKKSNP